MNSNKAMFKGLKILTDEGEISRLFQNQTDASLVNTLIEGNAIVKIHIYRKYKIMKKILYRKFRRKYKFLGLLNILDMQLVFSNSI